MRTATRTALVLTGTAVMIAAMATPGARADRSHRDGNRIGTTTATQRARPQPIPGQFDYILARSQVSVATAADHVSGAPEVANFDRGETWATREVAAASKSDRIGEKSVAMPDGCGRDTFASQQLNASDGGRGGIGASFGDASCSSHDVLQHRTRQVLVDETMGLAIQKPEPVPALIKFEAVISIDLAALNW